MMLLVSLTPIEVATRPRIVGGMIIVCQTTEMSSYCMRDRSSQQSNALTRREKISAENVFYLFNNSYT